MQDVSRVKKLPILVAALLFITNVSQVRAFGFNGDTLITMSDGRLVPIKDVQPGDSVTSYNKEFQFVDGFVRGVSSMIVDKTIHIVTSEDVHMEVSHLERFFLPKEGNWVFAKAIKAGDFLLNDNQEMAQVLYVTAVEGKARMYHLTVDTMHNIFASEGKYLSHNGFITGQALYWGTKIVAYGAVAAATAAATITGAGAVVTIGSAMAATGATGAIATVGLAGASNAVGISAAVAGTGLIEAGLATEAALLVTATAIEGGVAAGSVAGGIALVESTATTLGALGTLCVWLP